LDPLRALADLAAYYAFHRFDAVRLFGALRHVPFRRVPFRSIAAGGDNGARRDEHPRTGDDSLIDRLLETDVGVAGALRAEIADRREAGHERVSQVAR